MGRSRSSSAKSDRRESNGDELDSPKSQSDQPSGGIEFEYETEDGLKISIEPGEVEISREYDLDENTFIELSAGIDFKPADAKIEKKGLDLTVSGEIELPGNLLGVSGAVTLDLGTGEITGGAVGIELGGFEVEVSAEGEDGCRKAVSFSIAGVGIGFGRDDCEDEEEDEDEDKGEITDEDIPSPQEEETTQAIRIQPGKHILIFERTQAYLYQGSTFTETYTPISEGNIREAFRASLSNEELDYLVELAADKPVRATSWIDGLRYPYIIIRTYTENFTSWRSSSNSYNIPGIPDGIRIYFGAYSSFEIPDNGYINQSNIFIGYNSTGNPDSSNFWRANPTGASFRLPSNFQNVLTWTQSFKFSIYNLSQPPGKSSSTTPPASPPMRNNSQCCQETTEMLADIYEVLAVEELLSKKLKVPNRLIATNTKGTQELETYLDILAFIIRETDHLGIHPFTAILNDSNEAQEGNQEIEETYVNATAALKKIVELLFENKGDSSNRLNLLVRIAWINVQILNVSTVIVRGVQGLISYVGMPVREIIDKVTMPFDVTLGRRAKAAKGFGVNDKGKKPTREEIIRTLDLNEEDDLEAILPQLLETSEQPVKSETFNDDVGMNLIDMLRTVLRR